MNKYIRKLFLLDQIKSFENIQFYRNLEQHVEMINIDIFDIFICNMPKTIKKIHKRSMCSCFKTSYGDSLLMNSFLIMTFSTIIIVLNYQMYYMIFILPLCYILICLVMGIITIMKDKKYTIQQLIEIYESIYKQLEIPAVDCYELLK